MSGTGGPEQSAGHQYLTIPSPIPGHTLMWVTYMPETAISDLCMSVRRKQPLPPRAFLALDPPTPSSVLLLSRTALSLQVAPRTVG